MKPLFLTITSGILLFITTGCNRGIDEKPIISVTLLPQKYWIDQLAGEYIETNVMLQNGDNHETYEPTPEQMRKIALSSHYFSIGLLGFEKAWLPRMKSSNPKMKIINLSETIELPHIESVPCSHHDDSDHTHHHRHIDPHLWLEPSMVKSFVSTIAQELVTILPEQKNTIMSRKQRFMNEIDSIDSYIQQSLQSLENRKILIFHPALTWYAYRYNIEQIVIETDGKEPSPAKLKEIIDQIKTENIDCIFIQNEFPFERIHALAEATGIVVVQINPMNYDWKSTLIEVTNHIKLAKKNRENGE